MNKRNRTRMHPGIIFAVIGAIAEGAWVTMHKQASPHINNLFGAIFISFVAALVGLLILLPGMRTTELYSSPRGLVFAGLAGLFALAIDYFVLRAYTSGLPLSVVGPLIIGGGTAVAAIIGFFFGEPVNLPKLGGIALIIAGASILASFEK